MSRGAKIRKKILELRKYPAGDEVLAALMRIKNRELLGNIRHWKKEKNSVFLLMTPEHGNLGDHAIAIAEKKLLEKLEIKVYELTDRDCRHLEFMHRLSVLDGATLLITGGGYLGTLWPNEEILVRKIVSKNPHSQILALPSTVYYGQTKDSKMTIEESAKIYNAHPSLQFYAREKTSFDLISRYYRNVKMIPDMTLYLNLETENSARKGCLLLLRKDLEKELTVEKSNRILEKCQMLFGADIEIADTVLQNYVLPQNRNETLNRMWREMRSKELVITDRLHGMIFAALTETPCIVFDSKSPKLRGCYEWINHLGYIAFCNEPEWIPSLYAELKKQIPRYDNTLIRQQMKELEKDILQAVKQGE